MNSPMGRTQSVREITNNNKRTSAHNVLVSDARDAMVKLTLVGSHICASVASCSLRLTHSRHPAIFPFVCSALPRPRIKCDGSAAFEPERIGDPVSIHMDPWHSPVSFQLKQKNWFMKLLWHFSD